MSKLSDYAKELVEADALVKKLTDELDDAKKAREEITAKMLTEMQEHLKKECWSISIHQELEMK